MQDYEPGRIIPEEELLRRSAKDQPELADAIKRADQIIESAHLNEAVRVIQELEAEVQTMQIPARFRRDKKPGQNPMRQFERTGQFKDLTEDEYQRQLLLLKLSSLKLQITEAVAKTHSVVLEIEATKQE